GAPFLPRLVSKFGSSARVVLSPACWQLQAKAITPMGEGSDGARWFRGLQHWRTQWRVPRYVYLSEGDNRLLLDLENSLMVEELRDELQKYEGRRRISLDELLPDFEHLWLCDEQKSGYFSEIVVPLLRTDAVDPAAQPETQEATFTPAQHVITPAERSRFPGEDWVYLKLYAAHNQHEVLLVGPMRGLVKTLQERELIDRWFFIRYADPESHLRLRFHAKDGVDILSILALAFPWCLQLARHGQIQRYTLDAYEREVERYGGPEAIDLLEQVFTVDSVMVSDLVAFQHARRLTLDPPAVSAFTLDHFFTSWGCDLQQRLAWTHMVSEKYSFSKEFRPHRKQYCDLLSPRGQLEASLAEQRALLLELLHPYEPFLGELGTQVRQLGAAEKLWVPETSLLSSLAHMHINRLLGIDRTRERQIYAFWRHTLDSLERRPEQVAVLAIDEHLERSNVLL
ncbi:MAG: thiopeptide-type bacteriocin biosynthesis protein, partial [Ktedonobacteraceae bacterium]